MRFFNRQRNRLLSILSLTLAALLVTALAEDKPNFSGEWKLNVAKSDLGSMPAVSRTDKIEHKEPNLKVTSTQENQNGKVTADVKYTTDGKESTNEIRGNAVKSTAKWEGNVLAITSKANFNGNDITINDKWSLSKDGKTLTVNRQFEGPQGKFDHKIVLEKQ